MNPELNNKSQDFQKIINSCTTQGKKQKIGKLSYKTLLGIQLITRQNPVKELQKALKKNAPITKLKKKRYRGTHIYIPNHTIEKKRYDHALKWIIYEIKKKEKSKKTLKQKINQKITEFIKDKGKISMVRFNAHQTAIDNLKYTNHNK